MGQRSPTETLFGTVAAFLVWFGGTGYLLQHVYSVWFVVALGVAIFTGIGAAAMVFWFLAKVLMSREAALDPADYEMVGVLGKLSIAIRAGGTGELIYSQEGTRRVAGARSEDGGAIPKGSEVIVSMAPGVDPIPTTLSCSIFILVHIREKARCTAPIAGPH